MCYFCLAEIEIEKIVIHVWLEDSTSEKGQLILS